MAFYQKLVVSVIISLSGILGYHVSSFAQSTANNKALAKQKETNVINKNITADISIRQIEADEKGFSSQELLLEYLALTEESRVFADMTVPTRGEYALALLDEMQDRGIHYLAFAFKDSDEKQYGKKFADNNKRAGTVVQWMRAALGKRQKLVTAKNTEEVGPVVASNASARVTVNSNHDVKVEIKENGAYETLYHERHRDGELFEHAASEAFTKTEYIIDSYAIFIARDESRKFVIENGFAKPELTDGERESPLSIASRTKSYLQYKARKMHASGKLSEPTLDQLARYIEAKADEIFAIGGTNAPATETMALGRDFGMFNFVENNDGRHIDLIGPNNTFPPND